MRAVNYGLRLDTGSDTGWTAMGLAWRGASRHQAEPISRRQMRPSITATTAVSQQPLSAMVRPPSTSSATARRPAAAGRLPPTNGATLFEIRLQCFKSPNCHSDWSYAWTTSFTAAVHDGSPPAIAAGGSLLSGAVRAWSADPRRHGDRRWRGRALCPCIGKRDQLAERRLLSTELCRPVHRAQALPQLVQPAAFHRHPEGSRLDEWAERRCHLLDGCGWQSLLFMRSAGRERRQLMPGIRGNGGRRPRRRRGPRRPAQGRGLRSPPMSSR